MLGYFQVQPAPQVKRVDTKRNQGGGRMVFFYQYLRKIVSFRVFTCGVGYSAWSPEGTDTPAPPKQCCRYEERSARELRIFRNSPRAVPPRGSRFWRVAQMRFARQHSRQHCFGGAGVQLHSDAISPQGSHESVISEPVPRGGKGDLS